MWFVFRVYAPKCAACGQAITPVDVSRSADRNKLHITQAKQPNQRTKRRFMYWSIDCCQVVYLGPALAYLLLTVNVLVLTVNMPVLTLCE